MTMCRAFVEPSERTDEVNRPGLNSAPPSAGKPYFGLPPNAVRVLMQALAEINASQNGQLVRFVRDPAFPKQTGVPVEDFVERITLEVLVRQMPVALHTALHTAITREMLGT
jgi:hypothetical protein